MQAPPVRFWSAIRSTSPISEAWRGATLPNSCAASPPTASRAARRIGKSEVPSTVAEDRYTGFITEHGYASGTPASDGEAVYAFLGKSGVLACDLKGNKLWQTNVGTDSDTRHWGSGASPIVVGGLVIVNASSESQSIRVLDRKTGKEV